MMYVCMYVCLWLNNSKMAEPIGLIIVSLSFSWSRDWICAKKNVKKYDITNNFVAMAHPGAVGGY